MLLHRQTQTIDETQRTKFKDISKRLEEGLFKAASTKVLYFSPCLVSAKNFSQLLFHYLNSQSFPFCSLGVKQNELFQDCF